MNKRKTKKVLLLIFTITISLILIILINKSGWIGKSTRGIKNIDLIDLFCFILTSVICISTYISYVLSKNKGGEKIFTLSTYDYKRQLIFLKFELILVVYNAIEFIVSPSINHAFLCGIIITLTLNSVLSIYYINGIFEKGIIYGGSFYEWKNVLNYSMDNDELLVFKIRDKKKDNIELKVYIRNSNSFEIEKYLHRLIRTNELNTSLDA